MNNQAPLIDDSAGPRDLYILTALFGLGVVLYLARIYTRVVPAKRLDATDYACTVAVVAAIVTYILFATAVSCGFGRHIEYLAPENVTTILKCLFGMSLASPFASVFARVSLACLLLQFVMPTGWKAAIWAVVGFQFVILAVAEIVRLIRCRPIYANWVNVSDAHCLSSPFMWVFGFAFTSAGMTSDLLLAGLPAFLIWALSRSALEKCLVSFLMGMCLFATGAGTYRIIWCSTFEKGSADGLRAQLPAILFARLEEMLLIIAASAPLLKAPVEGMVGKLGLPTFRFRVMELNSLHTLGSSVSRRQADKPIAYGDFAKDKANGGDIEAASDGSRTGS